MTRTGSGRARVAAVLVAVLLAGGACTGDKPEEVKPDPPAEQAVPEVQLTTSVGVVTGKLRPARGKVVARRVGKVVDAWFDAAYLDGNYPRSGFGDAFPGFTRDAAAMARRDRDLLTNARIGARIDGVVALSKIVRVDLLSPKRRPAAATARFRLAFQTQGSLERRVVVSGRLMLTPVRGVWRIFAYDVRQSLRAAKGGGQ